MKYPDFSKRLSSFSSLIILFSALAFSMPSFGQLQAGTGKSNITADCGDVHDSLYVKALVLGDRDSRIAIITLDVVAIGVIGDIPGDFDAKVRRALREKYNIGQVLIAASHNHLDGFLNGGNKIIKDVTEQTILAAGKAVGNMEKVKAGAGKGSEDRFIMNRRIRMKDGKVFTVRHANPNMPDEKIIGPGETDPEIGILKLDRMNGTTKAVIYNYACHPYTGVPDKGVTAEFPGFASKTIEDNLGHGAMAFFLQGAAGDITEILYKDVNSPRDCEIFGQMLGTSTLKALREIKTVPSGKIICIADSVRLPLRTDIPDRLDTLDRQEKLLLGSLRSNNLNLKTFIPLYIKYSLSPEYPSYDAYRYIQESRTGTDALRKMDEANIKDMEKYLENIHTMEILSQIQEDREILRLRQADVQKFGGKYITAVVQAFRIGDFVLVTFPGEPFSRVGKDIKENSPFPDTFLAGYANGYLHYAPTADAYDEWGYEVMNTLLAPGWQKTYEEKAAGLITQLGPR